MKSMISAKKQESLQECLICEEQKDRGIYLLNYFICGSCEQEIVRTDTGERGYSYYLDRLKKVRDALVQMKENKVH